MTIGAAILLIAVGAILRFGISTVSTHGVGVHTIGDILMAVGVLGVVLWLIVWAPWVLALAAAARSTVRKYRLTRYLRPAGIPPIGTRPTGIRSTLPTRTTIGAK
jgi:hypothetical protein